MKFLDSDLGLINIKDDVPLWFSAFGSKSKELTAQLSAGWLNFGVANTGGTLNAMRISWEKAGNDTSTLQSNLFFLGAVLSGDQEIDEARIMAEAAPATAVLFHNLADEAGPMGGVNLDLGPMSNVLAEYLAIHEKYLPEDDKYLENHKGHLMCVRPEEAHITSDLAKATTMTGTHDELVSRFREIKSQGYSQVTVQLVHGHEEALERWAKVFETV